MSPRHTYDAVVVGSGPNGLAAAIVFAQTGRSVLVLEAQSTIGGGARSAELTLPGFTHDICSAVYPMAVSTGFLPSLPLEQHGLRWIEPPAAMAHPFDDGPPAILSKSIEQTGETLGPALGNGQSVVAGHTVRRLASGTSTPPSRMAASSRIACGSNGPET